MFGNIPGFPGFTQLSIANHYLPLAGETYGGTVKDPLIEGVGFGHGIELENAMLPADDFRSPAAHKAASAALHAHAFSTPAEREREARRALKVGPPANMPSLPSCRGAATLPGSPPAQAAQPAATLPWLAAAPPAALLRCPLQISPICPEAYNVLAVNASGGSNEKALEFYRRAEELGPQASKGSADLMSRAVPAGWHALCDAVSRFACCCRARAAPFDFVADRILCPASGHVSTYFCRQVVPPERLAEELRNDELWMRVCMRPYLR